MQPKIAIAASSGNPGAVSALLYVEVHADVCGWSMDAAAGCCKVAFFMLENFYAPLPAVLYRSVNDDVYGNWIRDEPPALHAIRCPLPENVVHEIEPLKSKLVQDWLMFHEDCADGTVVSQKRRPDAGHRCRIVGIKPEKVKRLTRDAAGLHYATPGFDANVLDYLQKFRRD